MGSKAFQPSSTGFVEARNFSRFIFAFRASIFSFALQCHISRFTLVFALHIIVLTHPFSVSRSTKHFGIHGNRRVGISLFQGARPYGIGDTAFHLLIRSLQEYCPAPVPLWKDYRLRRHYPEYHTCACTAIRTSSRCRGSCPSRLQWPGKVYLLLSFRGLLVFGLWSS